MPTLGGQFQSAVRLVPLTTTDANDLEAPVTGFDTKIDLTAIQVTGYTVANDDATSQEYHENEVGGDMTLRLPKNPKAYDLVSESLETSASGNKDKIKFKAYITIAQREAIKALKGKLVALMAFQMDTTGAVVYEEHLIGKLSGDIEFIDENGMLKFENEIVGKSISIDGSSTVTYSEYNTAMTGTDITPTGKSAITPTAIVTGDFTVLKTGLIQSVATA